MAQRSCLDMHLACGANLQHKDRFASAVFCQETQKSKEELGTYMSSALAAVFVVPAYMARNSITLCLAA